MELASVACISRPGRGADRWGQPMIRFRRGEPQADLAEGQDWSRHKRGDTVSWGRDYGLFVGWPGRGSVPWIVVIGRKPSDAPTAKDLRSFDSMCVAFDRTHPNHRQQQPGLHGKV